MLGQFSILSMYVNVRASKCPLFVEGGGGAGAGRRLGTSKIGILAGKSIVGEIVQFHKSCARAEKEVEKCENLR